MLSEIDPGLRALIICSGLGGAAYLWAFITDRQFTRKCGPDPK